MVSGSAPSDCSNAFYQNKGNPSLMQKVRPETCRMLDVGCGAGDNARLIRQMIPGITVEGITLSRTEADEAEKHMARCIVADIEAGPPPSILDTQYDCIVFSHVLEHMREPADVLAQFESLVMNAGQVLIAVPNIAFFRPRWQISMGRFEYENTGVFDRTHLRFFTYHSVERMLLANTDHLEVVEKSVSGSVPLWVLRRFVLPSAATRYLDHLGTRIAPNLFGGQVMLELRKRKDSF